MKHFVLIVSGNDPDDVQQALLSASHDINRYLNGETGDDNMLAEGYEYQELPESEEHRYMGDTIRILP